MLFAESESSYICVALEILFHFQCVFISTVKNYYICNREKERAGDI